jgi:hypothetical protein
VFASAVAIASIMCGLFAEAKLVVGGLNKRDKGYYVENTVFSNVSNR